MELTGFLMEKQNLELKGKDDRFIFLPHTAPPAWIHIDEPYKYHTRSRVTSFIRALENELEPYESTRKNGEIDEKRFQGLPCVEDSFWNPLGHFISTIES